MAYKALYRTYRPSTFDEVAGQQHIVKTLKNALKTGKIAHAYLFTGPRGTGKTTMAKLLAKALNCENGLGCQCNECKNCQGIIDGTHPDVLELDAASNNGVDNIRELIDNVKYGTILGKYKVYIIDEVHMLSPGAFNALLKTLEEPPENVIFILATTEPHKVLPTILSRCQRYDFSKVSDEDIKERIRVILNSENIEFNESAINLIIKLADGGMRDALSILDQVLAYSGDKLNESDVLDIFALESIEEKSQLLKSILTKDANDVLNRLNKYISKGSDLKRLTEDLLIMLKDILVFKTSRNSDFLEVFSDEEVRNFVYLVENDELLKMIDALMCASKDYKNVTSIAPIFEIALLKLVSLANDKNLSKKEEEIPVKEEPKIVEEVHKEEPKKAEPVVEKIPEQTVEISPAIMPVNRFEPDPVNDPDDEPLPFEKPEFSEPIIDVAKEEKTQEEPAPIQHPVLEPLPEDDIAASKPIFEDPVIIEQERPEIFEDKPKEPEPTPVLVKTSGTMLEIEGMRSGDSFVISQDDLLKMIVISKKEIKNNLIENWQKIKRLTAHPSLSKAATLLIDGRPLVASEKFIVIEYQLPSIANRVNLIEMQLSLQNVCESAFGKRMFVYGINRSQSVDAQSNFKHMYQAGRLPKREEINFKFLGE